MCLAECSYACEYVSKCVCVWCISAYSWAYAFMCAYGSLRTTSGVLPQVPSTLLFLILALSLAWNSSNRPGWLASKPRHPTVATSPVMEIHVCITVSGFDIYGVWRSNPDPVLSRQAVYYRLGHHSSLLCQLLQTVTTSVGVFC